MIIDDDLEKNTNPDLFRASLMRLKWIAAIISEELFGYTVLEL